MKMTKKVRRQFKQAMKAFIDEHGKRNYRALICEENARLRRILDRAQSDGKIGIVVSGMDCDCSSFHRERVYDSFSSVMEIKRFEDKAYEDAEGPLTVSFIHPSKINPSNNASRDLALEAFEDGHAHVVYY